MSSRTYHALPGSRQQMPIGTAHQMAKIGAGTDLSQWAQKNASCFKCSIITLTVSMVGLLIAMVVLLAAGAASGDMMKKTSESTIAMRQDTEKLQADIKAHIAELMSHFPENQEQLVVGQAFGIVENAHKISSRVEYLLNHMEPDTVPNVINSINNVLEKVQSILGNVNADESAKFMATADHLQELVANITPQQIEKATNGIAETAEHVGVLTGQAQEQNLMSRVTKLVEDAEAVVGGLRRVHSLTIDLPQLVTESAPSVDSVAQERK